MNALRTLVLSTALCGAFVTQAATFVVDTGSDAALAACDVNIATDCSLRGAFLAANMTASEDRIEFAIPESDAGFQATTGHWLILVGGSALPLIEAPVVIDGYSQPGAIANSNTPDDGGLNSVLKIEIRASTAMQAGLEISANFFGQAGSTFRGLAINRFQSQISLNGNGTHRVEGCFLGTNILGNAASLAGNSGLGNGVRVQGPGPYRIGGVLPAERNLISGMFGAVMFFSASNGVRIQGNLIGTDASGTTAIGNRNDAISSAAPLRNALIGGIDANARNIISATHFSALRLSSQSATDFAGTLIEGNYFGTDVTGTRALGNGRNPLSPSQPQATINLLGEQCSITIGGSAPGQANVIAFGGAAGILNDRCLGAASPLNRYYGNRGIAFDNVNGGGASGSTPNDAGDVDEQGGNRLQNFPEISLPDGFLPGGGGSVTLQYRVDSEIGRASYPITVKFYRAACGGGSEALIASDTYGEADARQLRSFVLSSFEDRNVLPLVATAVDAAGNTSEFSPVFGEDMFRDGLEESAVSPGARICN